MEMGEPSDSGAGEAQHFIAHVEVPSQKQVSTLLNPSKFSDIMISIHFTVKPATKLCW